MKRVGWYSRELLLFLMFLAIAGGASVFFFFLSSRDVKNAQNDYVWSLQVNSVLDRVAGELAYASQIDHPFEGESKECWYRRPAVGGALEPSLNQQGLILGDGMLEYVTRMASGTSKTRAFQGLENPLLRNVKKARFERRSSNLLVVSVSIQPPGATEEMQTFERHICLRSR
ncbi:MAG TPA: hypothetical protein PKM25_01535 [Candidatus Ozemobacteraceae bacterium]|nr:hypothetical protein [Candidatus Ozemobacteraceae bacterium]